MTTIAHHEPRPVTGGVDTHKDVHVAAVLDELGRLLATESFPTTRQGYRWLRSHGELVAVGVEGCGSWGAGLARFLTARGVMVVEVNRPNRQNRRRRGKSDTVDAEAAARAVLGGQATVIPKAGTGPVEAVRQLRIARSGAMKARTAAANQLHSLCDTAPDAIRAQLAGMTLRKKVAVAERWRPSSQLTAETAAKRALATVARRWRSLNDEARELSRHIKAVLDDVAPGLLAVYGVGYETAGQLVVTAGDNPDRLGNERSFAALFGASLVQASSGRTNRHRLNRGGDRQANSALWTIVMVQDGQPSSHPGVRRAPHGRRPLEARDHALPEALRRQRALPVHPGDHRPITPRGGRHRRPRNRRLTSRGGTSASPRIWACLTLRVGTVTACPNDGRDLAEILRFALSYERVRFTSDELTSLCPITGQPDFSSIEIDYEPNERCIESKSLKLCLVPRQGGVLRATRG